jgi:GDP-L-fucose synthase
VAGGNTLVGRALLERLQSAGHQELVGVPPREPDLTSMTQVDHFFAWTRPQTVFVAAGLSGGIHANQNIPADLMLNNMLVSAHILAAAFRHGVEKLLYLGSSCMYPRLARQPLRPDILQSGPLEATSAAYATAKLAGMTLCQAYRRQYGAPFITGIPANVFGPGDDFHSETGHVIPALMRRMHEAQSRGLEVLDIWGTGLPRREFIFAPDLADACLFVMNHYDSGEPINLGSGHELSVAEIARLLAEVVGFRGRLRFNGARPDGMPRKCLDSSTLFGLGWRPATALRSALEKTYDWFNHDQFGTLHAPGATAAADEACGPPWPRPEETLDARAAV